MTTPPYACQDCGDSTHVARGRCPACYAEWLLKRRDSGLEYGHIAARAQRVALSERVHALSAHIPRTCDESPTSAHWWLVDKRDYGICKYCKRERQFMPDLTPGLWR